MLKHKMAFHAYRCHIDLENTFPFSEGLRYSEKSFCLICLKVNDKCFLFQTCYRTAVLYMLALSIHISSKP